MPILNVYLDKELYDLVLEEAQGYKDAQGRSVPSKVVQDALRKYLGHKGVRK